MSATHPDAAPGIDSLVRRELGLPPHPEAPHPRKRWLIDPPGDLFGIALSGGGIRSATFNLGVLQALDRLQILRLFHYVSTVSGGGYLGSFWTRWRHAEAERGSVADAEAWRERSRVFPGGDDAEAPEPREIRHLREFSNFLAPRLGIFSFDTGRLLVAAVSSAVPSLLATLALLVLAVLGWRAMAGALFTPGGSPLAIGGLTLGALIAFEWVWRRRRERAEGIDYAAAAVVAILLTFGGWLAVRGIVTPGEVAAAGERLRHPPSGESLVEVLPLLAPSAAWGAAVLGLVFLRFAASRAITTPRARMLRAAFDRVQSRLLFLAVAWAVTSLLWAAGATLGTLIARGPAAPGATALAGSTAVLTLLFARVQQLLGREPNRPFGSRLLARLRPLLPQLLAYATIALLVVAAVVVVVAVEALPATADGAGPLLWLGLAAAGTTVATLLLLNPNEVGLHSFYRSRIVRAYLGAWDHAAARRTEEIETDDVALDRVDPRTHLPVHLVCCAANDLASPDPLRNLHRGAVSGVLSRVGWSVDDEWAPWDAAAAVPTLGAAATASAAAFNPLMGAKSVELGPGVGFLMAAFNLRLGLWLPHPTRGRPRWYQRLFPGLPFYKELFSLGSASGRDVHLSDGGHFENMAVYELIRRHCRVVLACDCGQDPDVLFDDLGNMARRVREDFGVEITIDLAPLRPGPDGRARQPMVAGDIRYPDGDTGILLVIKPTLSGDEPPDVGQYRSRNAAFPHESTGDQFYDAAQWEAYRRLGEHAAHAAFAGLLDRLHGDPAAMRRELFSRARREWLPEPDGFMERMPRTADRLAEIDALLCAPGAETVLHEVYKELGDLGGTPGRGAVQVPGLVGPEGRIDAAAAGGHPPRNPAPHLPDPADLAPSLHLIRRTLLLMHELYEREEMERNWHHPLLIGTMNYFARWAYAPLFRMWWPLLATLYPEPFTRFVERRFGLAARGIAASDEAPRLLRPGEEGFAMRCWLLENGSRWPEEGREVIAWDVPLEYHAAGAESGGAVFRYRVQAAQLIGERAGAAVVWDAPDFYVPAGLWGTGIGTHFLRALARHGAPAPGVEWLAVRLDTAAMGTAALARETRLYRDMGFHLVARAGPTLRLDGDELEIPERWRDRVPDGELWMARRIEPRAEPADSAAAALEAQSPG